MLRLVRRLPGWIAQTFAPPYERRPIKSAIQLRFELLEAREVPAVDVWISVSDTSFDNAANWSLGHVPYAGDDIVFGAAPLGGMTQFGMMVTQAIGGGGGGGGGLGSSIDCTGMHANASGDYNSVSLEPTYTGRVTLAGAIQTGDFNLSSGTIDQPSAGADITVTGLVTTNADNAALLATFTSNFLWTGGTLNSTANTANLNIQADGSIAPMNDGTLITGSTLNFIGTEAAPTTTTIEPGTLRFNNVAGAVIGFGYAATVRVELIAGHPEAITGFGQSGANRWLIIAGGSLEYRGTGTASSNMQILNEGGLFKLNGLVTLTLSGGALAVGDYNQAVSSDSKLHLVNGSTLVVTHSARISSGSVYLIMNPDLAANQQNATITGNFVMSGGDIVFASPITIGTALVYGTFTVNGNVDWTAGRYIPSVDYTTAGLANKWIVNGTMTSDAACLLKPNPQRGQNPPASSVWEVMDAQATAGEMPSTPPGCPLQLGSFPVAGRTKWRLSS